MRALPAFRGVESHLVVSLRSGRQEQLEEASWRAYAYRLMPARAA